MQERLASSHLSFCLLSSIISVANLCDANIHSGRYVKVFNIDPILQCLSLKYRVVAIGNFYS